MKFFIILALSVGIVCAKTSPMDPKESVKSVGAQPREFVETVGDWETVGSDFGDATAFEAPFVQSQPTSLFGVSGGFNLGLPGIINTALSIALGLAGVAMLIQLISKVLDAPIFDNLGRSLKPETIAEISDFANLAIAKLEKMYNAKQ